MAEDKDIRQNITTPHIPNEKAEEFISSENSRIAKGFMDIIFRDPGRNLEDHLNNPKLNHIEFVGSE